MILDISSLHRSKSDVFDFLPGGAVRVRRLNSFNRLTDYSFHPIELKLNRMIPDISRRFFSILTLGDVGTPVEISQTSWWPSTPFGAIFTSCWFFRSHGLEIVHRWSVPWELFLSYLASIIRLKWRHDCEFLSWAICVMMLSLMTAEIGVSIYQTASMISEISMFDTQFHFWMFLSSEASFGEALRHLSTSHRAILHFFSRGVQNWRHGLHPVLPCPQTGWRRKLNKCLHHYHKLNVFCSGLGAVNRSCSRLTG